MSYYNNRILCQLDDDLRCNRITNQERAIDFLTRLESIETHEDEVDHFTSSSGWGGVAIPEITAMALGSSLIDYGFVVGL